MKLYHYFSQRREGQPLHSTYEIGDGDGNVHLPPTGSAVRVLRFLRQSRWDVPSEMNGPQDTQYTVDLSASLAVHQPQSERDAHAAELRHLRQRLSDLRGALESIRSIRWGYDGDCGVLAIIDKALD